MFTGKLSDQVLIIIITILKTTDKQRINISKREERKIPQNT